LKTLSKVFKEKLGKSKSLRTFALPNRKKLPAGNEKRLIPTKNFILIENKICKLKKHFVPLHSQSQTGLANGKKRA
jgi:hypothetical protein